MSGNLSEQVTHIHDKMRENQLIARANVRNADIISGALNSQFDAIWDALRLLTAASEIADAAHDPGPESSADNAEAGPVE